ncbi:MAG: protein kinase [Planctomycetales bacterium]|nr:protein kinase [Planctomycetales bacterium]
MQESTCPNEQELKQLSQGNLNESRAASILNHVEHCSSCEAALESADASSHSLTARVRQSVRSDKRHAAQGPHSQLLSDLVAFEQRLVGEQGVLPAFEDQLHKIRDYRLVELIGEGGIGRVYRAEHLRLKRTVAIKLLRYPPHPACPMRQRFLNEMAIIGQLKHPNVVEATDAGEAGQTPFLVMEFLNGVDLSVLLKECGPLYVSDVCAIVRQVAEGLDYAHSLGLVHRDIKPSNLMLESSGLVKVLDLGLASIPTAARASSIESGDTSQTPGSASLGESHTDEARNRSWIVGTANYIAPEQAVDPSSADHRADIYSLGRTILCLLTLNSLEPSDCERKEVLAELIQSRPGGKANQVPEELICLIVNMLARDPNSRIGTMREVIAALDRITAKLPQTLSDYATGNVAIAKSLVALRERASHFLEHARQKKRIIAQRRSLMAAAAVVALLVVAFSIFVVPAKGHIQIQPSALTARILLTNDKHDEVEFGSNSKTYHVEPGHYQLTVSEPNDVFAPTHAEIDIDGSSQLVWKPVLQLNPHQRFPLVPIFNAPDEWPVTFRLSDDATQLMALIDDTTIMIWHTEKALFDTISTDRLFAHANTATNDQLDVLQENESELLLWVPFTNSQERLKFKLDGSHNVSASAISMDSKYLASGDQEGNVTIWTIGNASLIETLQPVNSRVNCLSWSVDGNKLVVGSADGQITIWDRTTRTYMTPWDAHAPTGVTNVEISPSGEYLLSTGVDRFVRTWELQSGELLVSIPHPQPVEDCDFVAATDWATTACRDGYVRLVDLKSGQVLAQAPTERSYPSIVRFVPSKQEVWGITKDRVLLTWSASIAVSNSGETLMNVPQRTLPQLTEVRTISAHASRVTSVDFHGPMIVSGSDDYLVNIFDWKSGTRLASHEQHLHFVLDVAFIPQSDCVISTGMDQQTHVWNLKQQLKIASTETQASSANSVAVSSDGQFFVLGFLDGTVKEFDTLTCTLQNQISKHANEVRAVAITRDNQYVASGDWSGTLHVLNRSTKEITPINTDTMNLETIALSPDCNLLAASGFDASIEIWGLSTMSRLRKLESGHDGPVTKLEFSPDGSLLATVGRLGVVKVWQTSDFELLYSTIAHNDTIRDVDFSDDGTCLATASHDGLIKIWSLPTKP